MPADLDFSRDDDPRAGYFWCAAVAAYESLLGEPVGDLDVPFGYPAPAALPQDQLEADARAALRLLSSRLLDLSVRCGEEMAAEARQARLIAVMPLESPEQLYRAVALADGVSNFVDNWSDCARTWKTAEEVRVGDLESAVRVVEREPLTLPDADALRLATAFQILLDGARGAEARVHDDLHNDCVGPARDAALAAVEALCALVDARVPV